MVASLRAKALAVLLVLVAACSGVSESPEAACFNGYDDNEDALLDCDDPTCATSVHCRMPPLVPSPVSRFEGEVKHPHFNSEGNVFNTVLGAFVEKSFSHALHVPSTQAPMLYVDDRWGAEDGDPLLFHRPIKQYYDLTTRFLSVTLSWLLVRHDVPLKI